MVKYGLQSGQYSHTAQEAKSLVYSYKYDDACGAAGYTYEVCALGSWLKCLVGVLSTRRAKREQSARKACGALMGLHTAGRAPSQRMDWGIKSKRRMHDK